MKGVGIMGFGNPRPSITFTNLTMTVVGVVLASTQSGLFRWIGVVLAVAFFVLGLIMGSWFQLLPGGKRIGHRDDP